MSNQDGQARRRSFLNRLRGRFREKDPVDVAAEGLKQHLREKEVQERAEQAREAREAARRARQGKP